MVVVANVSGCGGGGGKGGDGTGSSGGFVVVAVAVDAAAALVARAAWLSMLSSSSSLTSLPLSDILGSKAGCSKQCCTNGAHYDLQDRASRRSQLCRVWSAGSAGSGEPAGSRHGGSSAGPQEALRALSAAGCLAGRLVAG